MDTSDSSDDEKGSIEGRRSKLKIADEAENDEHSSAEENNKTKETETKTDAIESVTPVVKKIRKKKTPSTKRKSVRPKSTNPNPNPRSRKKVSPTGLNGNYWNVVQIDRHANTTILDRSTLNDEDSTSSSDEAAANEKLRTLIQSSSSSSSSSDVRTLLYSNRTFITCRSPGDSFFLCQVLQDVYNDTKRFRIRWCARTDGKDDEAPIDENTHFQMDFDDTLDPQTILTGIPDVIRHSDKTLSLSKQHIFETHRLLEKSIKGETSASTSPSDEPMDLTADTTSKAITTPAKESSDDDSLAIRRTPPPPVKIKKRKLPSDTPRKQPPKKRVRKESGEPVPVLKRQVTKNVHEVSEEEKEKKKVKLPVKKAAAKPVTTPKAQLFKVQSNRLLKENMLITAYRKDPFFEDDLSVPFISSIVQGKLAIRAVLINDQALLKGLITDVDHVHSVHVKRGLQNDLTAIHYAIKNDNIEMLRILLEDLETPKKDRCPAPTVSMTTQSTGRFNFRSFGSRANQVMAARGAKEGNNALNKDNTSPLTSHNRQELVLYALKNDCSRQVYDLLRETSKNSNHRVYDNLFHILRAGYRKLAASIIGDIVDNTFYGFNKLHHQVLLFDTEELTIKRAASVAKKSKDNFQITPIHCAAINPNSKYLKQLLNIMPEYNILDKYERRPIHFAAACEGPEPLEFLLSKDMNFNDVDRGGNSPLHIAAMNGRAINAEILLRTAKEKAESNEADDQIIHQKFGLASIDRLNKSRFYPLHLAVLNNHLECVKVLLQFGANVDALTSTSSGKLTPLMLACQKGYFKIVAHLIDNGAKIEARDRFKRTPLIHACMCGNTHIVSHLLRLGANAQAFDSSMNTALHYAIAYGWYFSVKILIEAGANVNAVNSWQTTCLGAGFLKGHYGLCDYLLTEHRVDINFKTDEGLTLVMVTVSSEVSASSVQQLDYVVVKHGGDCKPVDANGCNAFHYLASNKSRQDSKYIDRENLRDNFFKIAQILLDNQCDPNQMNNRIQSPLMLALESSNYILVDYLINKAKVDITADISHDGKCLLHYFALQCTEYDLVQTLIKLPITNEMKKMGQMFDNTGRTALHYCVVKFDEFCQGNQSTEVTDELKKQYQSIVQMIEFCLQSVQCDPDVEIKSSEGSETPDDNASTSNKTKETSIFFLLRTVPFADHSMAHPLEIFLTKSANLNALHHQTQRTPLLHAIHLKEVKAAQMLLRQSLCDINLSTSNQNDERQQTPLILACRLQLISIVKDLLKDSRCDILTVDYLHNQAIHYFTSIPTRSSEYVETLKIFIEKLKSKQNLNSPGKSGRTPLHLAVYHNRGTIDSTTDVEQILIDHGADVLIKDQTGNLPLHTLFLTPTVGQDPVELCFLMLKAMKSKSLDTENNDGYTPLHLAVAKCSAVCVTLLQQHGANVTIENKLFNTIMGTCIVSNHVNLAVNFLQQYPDMELSKMHTILVDPSSSSKSSSEKEIWKWKYIDPKSVEKYRQYPLIYLIIQRDWQGALSVILNEYERFHLSYVQIIEAAIANNKLNLALRLCQRIKEKHILHGRTSQRQNIFHFLANMESYDTDLFQQILNQLHNCHLEWNFPDKYGSYPIHYACVRHNFLFINFLREKYPLEFHFNQTDLYENTPSGLLFWTLLSDERIRPLITSTKQLDCLCNYDNEIAMNPLAFGNVELLIEKITYPPVKSDSPSLNNRTSPLIHAIVYDDFPLAKFLLDLGADVNFSDDEKRTPLMHAVRQNNMDMVKLLLNKEYKLKKDEELEDVNPRLKKAKKPQKERFFLGATTTTTTAEAMDTTTDDASKPEEFTVTSSIDLNASDSLGRTCIHHLVQPFPDGSYTSNIDLLRLLHRAGASLTKHDLAGLSPLQYGAINGCQHLCDELTRLINDQNTSTESTIERFYISDPNKDLLDSPPDFYADAQDYIDKYVTSHDTRSDNLAYQVDHLSGMSLTGEVLTDTEKNEPFDVRLLRTDVNYGPFGFYNFYRMQMIKHKSKKNLFFLFTRWGRVGDDGQYQLTPYSTFEECQKEFLKVFREKTGNAWKDTDHFEVKSKKYTLVKLNERELHKHVNVPVDFHRLQSDQTHPASKLHLTSYQTFLSTLINPQAIRANITKTSLDVEWMPVSQLKRETLQKTRDLLIKLKTILDRKQELILEMRKGKSVEQQNELKTLLETIYKYSNDYYTVVPLKGFAHGKLQIIDSETALRNQEKILDDLMELELAYKILLGAQANLKTISPLDYLYKSMRCQFEAMNKDDFDSQLILRYIWASAPSIQVEQIFKIGRPNEDERLFNSKLENHYLLWHGTGICNLISVLTRGLLVGPLVATATGSLFGKGIYTADAFAKSLGYCSGVKQNEGGERCFMILCEVALGKMKEVGLDQPEDNDDDNTTELDLNKFQSRKGVGKNIPDPRYTITRNYGVRIPLGTLIPNSQLKKRYVALNYNEYIVYDESQVALRYLVQFRR